MEIIKHKEPKSKKKKILSYLFLIIIFLLFEIIFGRIGGLYLYVVLTLIISLSILYYEFFENLYDGWSLDINGVHFFRINIFRGRQSIFINFNEINSIKYIQPQYRVPLSFVFYTNKGKTTLTPKVSAYKFAPILKYFYEKDIPINYSVSDYEIDLYIKGKIDSLPMTNDMEIKNS